jgi:hypothetical protein
VTADTPAEALARYAPLVSVAFDVSANRRRSRPRASKPTPFVRSRPVISLQSMGSLSEILFVAAAIIGLVSSRIFLFGTGEGGVNASALRRSLGLVSMVLTYSLFAWGFVSLGWYWPLAAYLVAALVAAIVVTFSPWRLLYSYRPALDFAAIAAGCYLWIEHWPFM